MSDPALTAPAVDYASPPSSEPRPASVSTIAGIGILFGALFTLCKPANLFVNLFMPMPVPNPIVDVIRNEPTLRAFVFFSTITGTLISVLLLMSSIGSLVLKPWARTGMFAYAALALLMTIVEQAAAVYILGPEMERAMRQSGMAPPKGVAWMSGWIGMALVLIFKLWFPALIFYFYTRPHVRRAFEQGLPGKGIEHADPPRRDALPNHFGATSIVSREDIP